MNQVKHCNDTFWGFDGTYSRLCPVLIFFILSLCKADAAELAPPKSLDPAITVSLIAAEPDIVTPVGCRFDERGNLFVIESHTHFPPEGYNGPKTDRIKVWRDTDGDQVPDAMSVFHEGTVKTMGLAIKGDWVYLITRSALLRIRDTDGDGRADIEQTLVRLETAADYPHNGLGGITFSPDGRVVFGLGENFGEPYELRGSDRSVLKGGGEGGNVFSCTADGGDLQWIATGFWNPFGIAFDPVGRLLVVGNDPDSAPPNRLVNVVLGGDYGFQFRFGRSGIHPLQAWNGELPATLPRISGTGEAACAVLPYRNRYWVTSWGDNRIETHAGRTEGATIKADPTVTIVGSAEFRPVDMAVGPDGSMYVTDWVDRSYPVHGRGRIWRLQFGEAIPTGESLPELSDAELLAQKIASGKGSSDETQAAANGNDPFLWQSASHALASGEELKAKLSDQAGMALAELAAWRWRELVNEVVSEEVRTQVLVQGLTHSSTDVRLLAVRWIAERRLTEFSDRVAALLHGSDIDARLVGPVAACLAYLETGKAERDPVSATAARMLVSLVADPQASDTARIAALRLVAANRGEWTDRAWQQALDDASETLQREAVRHVVGIGDRQRQIAFLMPVIASMQAANEVKRDALAILAQDVDERLTLEAVLGSAAAELDQGTRQNAESLLAEMQSMDAMEKPNQNNVAEWLALVQEGGDANRGWRVFYSATANCAACHALHGRGSQVGPDLTAIGKTQSREQLVQSIITPSRDIGPLYVAWRLLTSDGRVLTGIKLNGGGVGNAYRYLAADGTTFELQFDEIEEQLPAEVSLMPEDLHQRLSVTDLKDLLKLLEGE